MKTKFECTLAKGLTGRTLQVILYQESRTLFWLQTPLLCVLFCFSKCHKIHYITVITGCIILLIISELNFMFTV